jgi:hypothetical protein
MIDDPVLAKKVSDLMLEYGARIDSLAIELHAALSDEDFNQPRRALGKVMGTMLLEVMNPIYLAHPELKPPELV